MAASRPAAALDPADELVDRAAHGDVHAFARIVRLHHEGMTRVAFVVRGDPHAAAQATDAAWPAAWHGLRRRRANLGLGAWLSLLAATEAIRLAGGGADGAPDSASVVPHGATAVPGRDGSARPAGSEPGDDAQPCDHLARALDRLPPEDRALLALHHLAGIPASELGQLAPRSATPLPLRLDRLAHRLRGVVPAAADGPARADGIQERLRAFARITVRPVDADAVARRARAEESLERTRVASVAVGCVAGLLVVAAPYLAWLAS